MAELHTNFEQQSEYPLERIENPDEPLNWLMERVRLSKDKTVIIYNDFLFLSGIPPEAFNYYLCKRSAIDWVIEQYQVSKDERIGIVNDPNRIDDEEYIVRFIGKVVQVSVESVKIINTLSKPKLPKE